MIKVILWDIDGTLLDFEKAEEYAIRKCFSIFEMGICTDEMLERYSKINRKYWEQLERGEITKTQVLVGRFQDFFEKEGLDVKKAEPFNEEYQLRLGDRCFFCDNGLELVKDLKGKVKQYAVTNGTRRAQERKLSQSGLDQVLDGIFISELVGIEKPNVHFFEKVFEKIEPYEKDEILIVGDSLTSDMQGGNNAGILCCWYNPKQTEKHFSGKIDLEIQNLNEIKNIFN